jgi:hypothetical protein
MKKQTYFLSFLFVSILASLSFADVQTISLKDGSQLKGELTGISNGVYTVHTSNLGDIKINASEVSNIGIGAPPAAQQAPISGAGGGSDDLNLKIKNAQTKLMQDPAMMQQVQAMAQDPELMKMLSDPELTQAVMSHDVKAIENNPRAQQLMSNPKMRALMEQMKERGMGN